MRKVECEDWTVWPSIILVDGPPVSQYHQGNKAGTIYNVVITSYNWTHKKGFYHNQVITTFHKATDKAKNGFSTWPHFKVELYI